MIDWIIFILFWCIFFVVTYFITIMGKTKSRTGHHDSYPGSYYYESHKKEK